MAITSVTYDFTAQREILVPDGYYRIAVVEVDTLVPVGEPTADVHLSGIFVQRIFQGRAYEDPIEYRTTRPR